jgi:hypothetical protein
LASGRWARPGRGPVGPNGGCRSPKRGGGARRRPPVIEYSPVGGLGLGCAAGAGDSPVDGGLRRRGGLRGREGPRAGPPGGSRRAGHARRGPGGRAARTTIVGNIYIYMYCPPARCTKDIYPGRVGGPTGDSPVEGRDSPVGGEDSPVGGKDSPVGGPERRVKISKSRPRRVLRIKTGPLTMGQMSCTDHLHTSPIVKDPYSNCGLGTERLHGWHPPNDGRRVCVEVRRKSLLRTYHCWRVTS